MKEKIKFSLKPVLLLAGLILIIFGIISIIFSGKFWGWLLVFPYFGNKIQEWTGVGYWISRAISIPIALVAVFYLPWLFSWKKDKRTKALIVLATVATVFCIAMAIMYADRNFDPSGKAVKCVAENGWGQLEEVNCGNEFHPIFGTPVKKITPKIAREMSIAKYSPPPIKRVVPDLNYRLFTSDGKPLLWYYQYPDGKLEFFAQAGIHPGNGLILSPVNTEVAKLLYKNLAEGRRDMIIADGTKYQKSAGSGSYVEESLSELSKLSEMLKKVR